MDFIGNSELNDEQLDVCLLEDVEYIPFKVPKHVMVRVLMAMLLVSLVALPVEQARDFIPQPTVQYDRPERYMSSRTSLTLIVSYTLLLGAFLIKPFAMFFVVIILQFVRMLIL